MALLKILITENQCQTKTIRKVLCAEELQKTSYTHLKLHRSRTNAAQSTWQETLYNPHSNAIITPLARRGNCPCKFLKASVPLLEQLNIKQVLTCSDRLTQPAGKWPRQREEADQMCIRYLFYNISSQQSSHELSWRGKRPESPAKQVSALCRWQSTMYKIIYNSYAYYIAPVFVCIQMML